MTLIKSKIWLKTIWLNVFLSLKYYLSFILYIPIKTLLRLEDIKDLSGLIIVKIYFCVSYDNLRFIIWDFYLFNLSIVEIFNFIKMIIKWLLQIN